jgi:hypothetical protein
VEIERNASFERLSPSWSGYVVTVRYASTLRLCMPPTLLRLASGRLGIADRSSASRGRRMVGGNSGSVSHCNRSFARHCCSTASAGTGDERSRAASCIAFGLASVRASQTESRVYLGDTVLEMAFLAAWRGTGGRKPARHSPLRCSPASGFPTTMFSSSPVSSTSPRGARSRGARIQDCRLGADDRGPRADPLGAR